MSDDFKKSWIEGFYNLAVKMGKEYKKDPDKVLSTIGFKSILECLLETYNNLVKQNEIPKLEELAEDHKRTLWLQSEKYSDEKVKRIAICKAIYLLDVLTKED